MPRKPIVADMFYPADPKELEQSIKSSFLSKFGPGSLPKKERTKNILGIISPHAGYVYSGAGAVWGYKEVAESKIPDIYIMLGLSHNGYPSCVSLEDWETPLGIIKTDKEFNKEIMKNTGLKQNESAHSQEHSIEVQLPFLQFVNRNEIDKVRIAPIIVSEDKSYEEIALGIVKTLKETKKTAIIIASSDFTHFGLNYGYLPFKTNVKENMYKLDKGAIDEIKKLNAYKFLDYIDTTGATICGRMPIATLLETCKLLGAKKAELLKYYTSGDIIGDYNSAVGYGAISISNQ